MLDGNVSKLYNTRCDLIPGKVAIDFNMLRSLMKDRIGSNVKSSPIITVKNSGLKRGQSQILQQGE